MKRIKMIGAVVLLALLMVLSMPLSGYTNFSVSTNHRDGIVDAIQHEQVLMSAPELVSDASFASMQIVTQELFGNKQIQNIEYLYSLDSSPDFIHVEFIEGYAIFLRETLSLMEFSQYGHLPFPNTDDRRYYAGPMKIFTNNYLTRNEKQFKNAMTGEEIFVSTIEVQTFSENVRENLFSHVQPERRDIQIGEMEIAPMSSAPHPDRGSVPAEPGSSEVQLIPNYRFFLENPWHARNTNTCGAVAAQLLLSYHNYYHDRRIIDNQHLNPRNPHNTSNPMERTGEILGSANSFHDYLTQRIPGNDTHWRVRDGIRGHLNSRNISFTSSLHYNILGVFGWASVNTRYVIREVAAGNPTIVSMLSQLGGINHFVVAYGHQYMNSAATNNRQQFGYIVHYGWSHHNNPQHLRSWINAAWCSSVFTLQINHTHDHQPTNNSYDGYWILQCTTCQHRILNSFAGGTLINEALETGTYNMISNNLSLSLNSNNNCITINFHTSQSRTYDLTFIRDGNRTNMSSIAWSINATGINLDWLTIHINANHNSVLMNGIHLIPGFLRPVQIPLAIPPLRVRPGDHITTITVSVTQATGRIRGWLENFQPPPPTLFGSNGTINATIATQILSALNSTNTAPIDRTTEFRLFPDTGTGHTLALSRLYWRITHVAGDRVTLWASQPYRASRYHPGERDDDFIEYRNSELQTRLLNDFSFIQNIAGDAILRQNTDVDDANPSDMIWLPSEQEVRNGGLWGLNETLRSFDGNVLNLSRFTFSTWLRNRHFLNTQRHPSVADNGNIVYWTGAWFGDDGERGVRPALHLSLSKLLAVG